MLGYFQIEIHIPAAHSLKEKRFVLNSIKDRTRKKFNVSVSELEGIDTWQRSSIGMAMVSNSQKLIESCFDKILQMLDHDDRFEIIDRQIEYFK